MNLSMQDMELIASLKEDLAYQNLLSAIEAELDNTSAELEDNPKLHSFWKALRLVYRILKTYPERITMELQAERNRLGLDYKDDFETKPIPPTQLKLLEKYFAELNKKNESEV